MYTRRRRSWSTASASADPRSQVRSVRCRDRRRAELPLSKNGMAKRHAEMRFGRCQEREPNRNSSPKTTLAGGEYTPGRTFRRASTSQDHPWKTNDTRRTHGQNHAEFTGTTRSLRSLYDGHRSAVCTFVVACSCGRAHAGANTRPSHHGVLRCLRVQHAGNCSRRRVCRAPIPSQVPA